MIIPFCSSRNAPTQCRLSSAAWRLHRASRERCAALPRHAAVGRAAGRSWLWAAQPWDLRQAVRLSQEAICDMLVLYARCFRLACSANETRCLFEQPFHFNRRSGCKRTFYKRGSVSNFQVEALRCFCSSGQHVSSRRFPQPFVPPAPPRGRSAVSSQLGAPLPCRLNWCTEIGSERQSSTTAGRRVTSLARILVQTAGEAILVQFQFPLATIRISSGFWNQFNWFTLGSETHESETRLFLRTAPGLSGSVSARPPEGQRGSRGRGAVGAARLRRRGSRGGRRDPQVCGRKTRRGRRFRPAGAEAVPTPTAHRRRRAAPSRLRAAPRATPPASAHAEAGPRGAGGGAVGARIPVTAEPIRALRRRRRPPPPGHGEVRRGKRSAAAAVRGSPRRHMGIESLCSADASEPFWVSAGRSRGARWLRWLRWGGRQSVPGEARGEVRPEGGKRGASSVCCGNNNGGWLPPRWRHEAERRAACEEAEDAPLQGSGRVAFA